MASDSNTPDPIIPPANLADISSTPWWSEMTRYHWFVFVVAALGWLFDCLDQQLFILARQPAMSELLQPGQSIDAFAAYATSIFLLGWGMGGLLFGILGDRIGRAKTMIITILLYSLFTGLSALSRTFYDFALYRFLTGLGVGGEFAVGVALVAEVMPARARPRTLALLQALSAVGNVTAALVAMGMGQLVRNQLIESTWRPMFVVGAIPALLALIIRRRLKEPERWEQVSHGGEVKKQLGSYRALFGDPRWRKNALLGLAMALSGVVGLWAVVFFAIDLVGNIKEVQGIEAATTVLVQEGRLEPAAGERLQERVRNDGLDKGLKASDEDTGIPKDVREHLHEKVVPGIKGDVAQWKGITSLLLNFGAFIGMYTFGFVTQRIGRKPTFLIAFLAAAASTAAVFLYVQEMNAVYYLLIPVMGVCTLSLFAGYAIYFPELFPTYLRSTGTSFCYNIGRFITAGGLLVLGALIDFYDGSRVERLRDAGLTMCIVFFIGLLALPFAPETKDQPLPE